MKRCAIKQPIRYGTEQRMLLADYSVNMSDGGLFLETSRIYPVNADLYVEIELPGNETSISCKARVAWTNEPGDRKSDRLPPGMGLQFSTLSQDQARAIRDFLVDSHAPPRR